MNRCEPAKILRIFILLAVLFVLTVLNGCSSDVRHPNGDDVRVKYLVGMSQANLVEPWRVAMNNEIKSEAAMHKNLRIIFTDAAQSSRKQVKDVQELLDEGIDLLIISPNETGALTPIVAEAYEKIPVIVLDRAVEGYDYTLYIGPDNKMTGKKAGKLVVDLLGDKGGNVIEIAGLPGSPPVRDRDEGFREVISQHPKIKIVDTVNGDWLRDKAEDKIKEIAGKHPKIDVIFAQSDPMALGAYNASKMLRLENIRFVGIDGLPGSNGGLQLVERGILSGTFACPTGGKEAIRYAIDILNHVRGIPKKIILRSDQITGNNVRAYIQEGLESKPAVPGGKEAGFEKTMVLGYAQVGSESAWREANSQSIQSAAKEAGIDLRFINAESNQQRQIEAIRQFIREKVDVIAFSPLVESGWDEVLREARAANIPVICSDRAVKVEDDSLYSTFIGSDFVEEGRRAARWVTDYIKGKEQVNVVEIRGTSGSDPAIGRTRGFSEVLGEHKNFRIIATEAGDFTLASGKRLMKFYLDIYGKKIDMLYAHNDDMALGAIQAMEEYGLKPGKDVVIVSIDGTMGAFKAMKAGKINCTIECNPLLGPQLMKAVKDYVDGKELPLRIITSEGVFPQETAGREIYNRKY